MQLAEVYSNHSPEWLANGILPSAFRISPEVLENG
jgi:hypothetical protein